MSTRATPPRLVGPTPPEKPLSYLRQAWTIARNPLGAFPRKAYEALSYEMSVPFGPKMLLVNDTAAIKHVLLDSVSNYPKMAPETVAEGRGFGDGILTSSGDKWRSHRRTMSPAFDMRSLASYAPSIVEVTSARLAAWDQLHGDREIEVCTEMSRLTLEIIGRLMFSTTDQALAETVYSTLAKGQAQLAIGPLDLLPGGFKRQLKRVHDTFSGIDESIYQLIAQRQSEGASAPRDLLGRLVAALDAETGAAMTPVQIRDEVFTMFFAGHETTAIAMTFTWYLLAMHPEIEAKLHAELNHVLQGRAPRQEDLENLPYTRMVLQESMRLYPPAPGIATRIAEADDVIGGVPVKKGSGILILPWILHRHRAYWENAEVFDPERFSPERSAARPRFIYMPFGAGPRICIGSALAMMEASLMLADIAQRYRFELVSGQDIGLQVLITLKVPKGIRMRLVHR